MEETYATVPCYRIRLVRERNLKVPKGQCTKPADIAAIVRKHLRDTDRETFVVLLANTQHAIVGINTVSVGTLNTSVVHAREVFKAAIVANAAAIFLAHNHPSGMVSPSMEDITVTRDLVAAGKLLGIPVIDHVIVSTIEPFDYYSLAANGQLDS